MSDHNGFRNAISILTVEWQQRGCQHCKNRRSQDYQCQAYQAKGMMNWSCRFCDKDKGVHFKGMYSKKLFCTDPRQVKVISGIQSTADANDTTAAASGGGIDKDPPSKLEQKIIAAEKHRGAASTGCDCGQSCRRGAPSPLRASSRSWRRKYVTGCGD